MLKKIYVKEYLKVFLLFIIVYFTLIYIIIKIKHNSHIENLKMRESLRTSIEKNVIEKDMEMRIMDIQILSKFLNYEYFSHNEKEILKLMEEIFYAYLDSKKEYYQLRYLDEKGNEILKIENKKNGIIKKEKTKLQNKENRYYYKNALENLKEIYVSKFDLNIENEKIENPYKPTIRFISFLKNEKKDVVGMIVFNYNPKNIINRIKSINNNRKYYILNQEGYWITSDNENHEFAFMFQNKNELKFSNLNKEAWEIIKKNENGQFVLKGDLFTFEKAKPIKKDEYDGYYEEEWIILSIIDKKNLNNFLKKEDKIVFLLGLILFTLISFLIFLYELKIKKFILFLKQNEEKFNIISNSSKDGIIILNQENIIEYSNESANNMFGYSENEIKGERIEKIFETEDTKEEINDKILLEKIGIKKDGNSFFTEVSIGNIKINNKIKKLKIIRDINEKKQIEINMKKFINAVNSSADMIFITDTKGIVEYINPAFTKITGYSEDEIYNKNISLIKSGLNSREYYNKLWETILKGEVFHVEVVNKKKNGERFYYDQTITPVKNYNGEIINFVSTGKDISEKKLNEEKLEEYRKNLEKMVDEKTKELIIANEILKKEINLKEEIEKKLIIERDLVNKYFETAGSLILILDKNANIKKINNTVSIILGYTQEEIIGKNFIDIFLNSEKKYKELLKKINEDLEYNIDMMEISIKDKNEKKHIIYWHNVKLYDENNQLSEILISGEDITRIIEAGEEKEKLLKEMSNRIKIINCLYGVSTIINTDKNLDEILELISDIIPLGIKNTEESYVVIEYKNKIYKFYEDKKLKNIYKKNIVIGEKKEGSIELHSKEALNKEEEKLIDNISRMVIEMLIKKQIEQELLENEKKLKETQNLAKLGYWEYDFKNDKIFWSEETYKIFGLENGEYIDFNKYLSLIYEEDKHILLNKLEELKNNKKTYEIQIRKIKKDNSIFYSLSKGIPYLENGELKKVYGFIMDITELKTYEIKLKKAKQEAEKANKAKSVFVANMSHEIRTPLNAILGFTQILLKEEHDEKIKEKINIIKKSGEHLLLLINDILEISKIEAGKIKIEKTKFDIQNMVNQLKDMFLLKMQKKDINFNFIIKNNIENYIETDEQKLKQIFINLIGNSLKFTEKGFVECVISFEKNSYDKNILKAYIADSGVGIAEEDKENIFDEFEQGKNYNSAGGTGLGLAITKKFIELLNGKIKFRSEINKGSIFEFDIPIEISEEKIPEIYENQEEKIEIKFYNKKRMTILIVDDDLNTRKIIKEFFKNDNFEILEAENGKIAIDVCLKKSVDFIFMDINMPVMDGKIASEKIKNQNKNVIIIGITANISNDKEKNDFKNFSDIILKPFKEIELKEVLGKYMEIKKIYKNESQIKYNSKNEIILENLDVNIKLKLYEAVQNGDIELIEEILIQIKLQDENYYNFIKDFTDNYEYDKLMKILT